MKERPILFSGPMVRAIIDGRKTQTRRVVKPQPTYVNSLGIPFWPDSKGPVDYRLCPHGCAGDRIWVRETFRLFDSSTDCACYDECRCASHNGKPVYRADYDDAEVRWKPSIFMPRWASRITLEITGVRVERLQDTSEADAIAEGIERSDGAWASYSPKFGRFMNPITSYHSLWESINGPGSWAANPWVWVIEFKRITPTSEEGEG